MEKLKKLLERLEDKNNKNEKVDTVEIIKWCKKHKISPPTLFREAAKKNLMGVFR